ncbi:tetratricopeptide repeat protein [Rhizobium setariae]|nr:tetratricopeptide repeat protein [Rhizobium setariae]
MSKQSLARFGLIAAATISVAAANSYHAFSQTPSASNIAARMLGADEESQSLTKGERLLPAGNKDDLPVLASPVSQDKDKGPSAGLKLLERMGTGLPDLPPEKAFSGTIDNAYGAYQRGLYLTAMNLALPKAQLGEAAAQTLVAELLNNGLGVRRNPSDAAFWYEQAATSGDANAQFKYAMMLMEGKLVTQDRKKADKMMQKAAEGGNREAQFNIAQIKVAAAPGEKGLNAALPWYEKAAEQGVPDAQYALAQLYISLPVSPEKKAQARDWLLKAANARFDTALYDMGLWYINGIGGEKDYDQGFAWLKRAANRGHVLAQNKLAHLYINAIGTRPDPIEAAKWYVLSRRAGFADLELEDFFLGIEDATQKEAIHRANIFRAH